MNQNDKYTYRVTWSEEDTEYVGLCAEFSGLSWLACTPEAELEGGRRVVNQVIADMLRNKENDFGADLHKTIQRQVHGPCSARCSSRIGDAGGRVRCEPESSGQREAQPLI